MYIIKNKINRVKCTFDCDRDVLIKTKIKLVEKDMKLSPFIELLLELISEKDEIIDLIVKKEEE